MDLTELFNRATEEREEILLTISDTVNTKVRKKQINDFINNSIDEIEEYIKADTPERAKRILELDETGRALLLNSCLTVLDKAVKICDGFVRLSYQLNDTEPKYTFVKTDLLCIAVDIMN